MASELHRGDGDRDFVRSLQRGLEVVRALGHPGPGMTLAEVARAIGANRASTRLALPEVARPHLQRLMEETGEFSSLSVLDGDETVCVARVAPPRIMNVAMPVGTRLPAYATCVGRVLLAELAPQDLDAYLGRVELRALTPATLTSPARLRAELNRVRRRRWALVDQELERGLRSAAAPVRDAAGNVIAAANVGALAGRITVATLRKALVPRLLESAASIERDLAVAGP